MCAVLATCCPHLSAETKVRADAGRNNDARLDAKEEETAESLRKVSSEERAARHEAARTFKIKLHTDNHAFAKSVREKTGEGLARSLTERSQRNAIKAEEKKRDAASGKELQEEYERERLRKQAAARQAVMATREKARMVKAELVRVRTLAVRKEERDSEARVAEARSAILHDNREKRGRVFGSRYVSREAAESFESSAFRKLYAMDDTADAEIDKQNELMLAKINTVAPRTDDLINDDAAGEARAVAAAASAARKAQEASRIAKENAEMRMRIRSVKAITDDDLDDDAAGEARAKAAAASKARREAEAAKLAKANAEMKRRIANTKAATDDDITDDVGADGTTGAGRKEAAAASKARKAATAAKLASENEATRRRIKNTAARTDDDLLDDVLASGQTAGQLREESAAAHLAVKEREAAALAKANAEMRERIANTKAVVDDDLMDEAAGQALATYDPHHRGWQKEG